MEVRVNVPSGSAASAFLSVKWALWHLLWGGGSSEIPQKEESLHSSCMSRARLSRQFNFPSLEKTKSG